MTGFKIFLIFAIVAAVVAILFGSYLVYNGSGNIVIASTASHITGTPYKSMLGWGVTSLILGVILIASGIAAIVLSSTQLRKKEI